MANVGTISSLLILDTTMFNGSMAESKAKVADLANTSVNGSPLVNSLKGAGHGVKDFVKGITSDWGVFLKLGFGIGGAKAILGAAHHAIIHLGEGFMEARKAGLNFGESIGDAVTKMLGLTTEAERHTEAIKKLRETWNEATKAKKSFDEALAASQGKHATLEFPHLKPEVSRAFEEKQKAMSEAQKKAGEANQAVLDYKESMKGRTWDSQALSGDSEKLARLEEEARKATGLAQGLILDLNQSEQEARTADEDAGYHDKRSKAVEMGLKYEEKIFTLRQREIDREDQLSDAYHLRASQSIDRGLAHEEKIFTMRQAEIDKEEEEQKRRTDHWKSMAEKVVEQSESPFEKYMHKIGELNTLKDHGDLSKQQFDSAAKKAGDDLMKDSVPTQRAQVMEVGSAAAERFLADSESAKWAQKQLTALNQIVDFTRQMAKTTVGEVLGIPGG